jgi:hypothetical protein
VAADRQVRMYAYTDALAREFDQALSELHAADGENPAWARLKELPKRSLGKFAPWFPEKHGDRDGSA